MQCKNPVFLEFRARVISAINRGHEVRIIEDQREKIETERPAARMRRRYPRKQKQRRGPAAAANQPIKPRLIDPLRSAGRCGRLCRRFRRLDCCSTCHRQSMLDTASTAVNAANRAHALAVNHLLTRDRVIPNRIRRGCAEESTFRFAPSRAPALTSGRSRVGMHQNNKIEEVSKKLGARPQKSESRPMSRRKELLVAEPENQPAAKREVILPQSEKMRVHIVSVQANREPRRHLDIHAAAGNESKLER